GRRIGVRAWGTRRPKIPYGARARKTWCASSWASLTGFTANMLKFTTTEKSNVRYRLKEGRTMPFLICVITAALLAMGSAVQAQTDLSSLVANAKQVKQVVWYT